MTNDQRALGQAAILGIAHGAADAASGFAIAVFALHAPYGAAATILIYNAIAFALQPAFGLFIDKHGWHRPAAGLGILLITAGLITLQFNAPAALMIIAIGSGIFHVGAGAMSAKLTPMKAIGPGFFTAPGVFGLALGTVAGLSGVPMLAPLIALLTFAAIGVMCVRENNTRPDHESISREIKNPTFPIVAGAVIVLAIGVAFRSAEWSAVGAAYPTMMHIVALGFGAMLGKLLGGIFADKFGWAVTAFAGAALAAPLMAFSGNHIAVLSIGVLLLQSSTPIVLAALMNAAPKYAATMAGLAVGLFLALGGVASLIFGQTIFFGTLSGTLIAFCTAIIIGAGIWLVEPSNLSRKYCARENR